MGRKTTKKDKKLKRQVRRRGILVVWTRKLVGRIIEIINHFTSNSLS